MVGNMNHVILSVSDWGNVKHPKTGKTETVKKFTWVNDKNKVKIEVSHVIFTSSS